MYFDRFDICEAWYLWLSENHEGQWSDKYRRLSRMSEYYTPPHSLSVENLGENAREIYEALCAG